MDVDDHRVTPELREVLRVAVWAQYADPRSTLPGPPWVYCVGGSPAHTLSGTKTVVAGSAGPNHISPRQPQPPEAAKEVASSSRSKSPPA